MFKTNEQLFNWINEMMGEGSYAGEFHPHAKVWSLYEVRAAILRALKEYEKAIDDGCREVSDANQH